MTDIASSSPRIAGKKGRLPALQGADRLPIPWFHEIFAGANISPTYPVDATGGRHIVWEMLGNGPDSTLTVTIPGFPDLASTGCGDCFFAGVGHDEILAGGTVNADGTVTLYFNYDKDQDLGVVVADALMWLYQQGIIEAFAPVHPDNIDATMQLLGKGVLLGVNLTDTDMGNFEQNPPVTWECGPSNPPNPNEGHVVYKIRSTSFGGDGTIVTWGDEQPVGGSWLAWQPAGTVEEAWAILTSTDKANLPADQWATLVAALDALPGATPPQEPPAPAPAPPAPAPPAPVPPAPFPPVAPPPPPPTPAPVPPLPFTHVKWWQELLDWYEDAVKWFHSAPHIPPAPPAPQEPPT